VAAIICVWCRNVQYIERDGTEFFHTLKVYPEALNKKMTLLKYFRNYMSEHLLKVTVTHCHLSSRTVHKLMQHALFLSCMLPLLLLSGFLVCLGIYHLVQSACLHMLVLCINALPVFKLSSRHTRSLTVRFLRNKCHFKGLSAT